MRFITGLAMVVLFISATASAQQGATTTSKKDDGRKPITVVGCLQNGAQANQFVLAATADPLAKGVAVATSGAVPNVTYVLSGGTNLGAHLGHRVEITGRTSGDAQKAVSTDSSSTKGSKCRTSRIRRWRRKRRPPSRCEISMLKRSTWCRRPAQRNSRLLAAPPDQVKWVVLRH